MKAFPITAEAVAQHIDLDVDDWINHCDLVVRRMKERKVVGPNAVIERMSPGPWEDPADTDQNLIFHDYLRLEDGRVVDPTRWCYQSSERPFIYVGLGDGIEYDGKPLAPFEPPRLERVLHRRRRRSS